MFDVKSLIVDSFSRFLQQGDEKVWSSVFNSVFTQQELELASFVLISDFSVRPFKNLFLGLVYAILPKSNLYKDIVSFRETIERDGFEYIEFMVDSKQNQLNKCQPNWVYENYKEVEEFMSETNPYYLRLLEISKNFPIVW